jgi:hypothetical protein
MAALSFSVSGSNASSRFRSAALLEPMTPPCRTSAIKSPPPRPGNLQAHLIEIDLDFIADPELLFGAGGIERQVGMIADDRCGVDGDLGAALEADIFARHGTIA